MNPLDNIDMENIILKIFQKSYSVGYDIELLDCKIVPQDLQATEQILLLFSKKCFDISCNSKIYIHQPFEKFIYPTLETTENTIRNFEIFVKNELERIFSVFDKTIWTCEKHKITKL